MNDSLPLNKAALFVVIAIELRSRTGSSVPPTARETFVALLGSALGHACKVQPAARTDGSWACSALIADNGQILALLRRLEGAQNTFHKQRADERVRFLTHHGLAFETQSGEKMRYVGSTLRAAHSLLGRLPTDLERGASADFVKLTQTWSGSSITFEALSVPEQPSGLYAVTLDRGIPIREHNDKDADAALRAFLVERLSLHMGPFAQVLVDSARMSARSREHFIEETAREIDDIKVRDLFREQAIDFLRNITKH